MSASEHRATRCVSTWLHFIVRSIAICGLLGTSAAFAQTPVASWSFDEGSGTSTADTTGNGHTGTLTNGPTWVTGHAGNALSYGGTKYVAVPAASGLSNLASTGMTIAAWVKPNSGGTGGRILDKDNNAVGWFLKLDTGQLSFVGDWFTTTVVSRVSASTLTSGTWQHVAVTWNGSATGTNIHIYINGVLSDGTAANGSGSAGDDSGVPLAIGNRSVDAAKGFDGTIDDVRVFNQVLTATQVAALIDTTAPSAPTGASATTASSSQINLSWTASTDNVGVTGYLIERCTGLSCSSFTQIATPTGTSYSDTGLSSSTSYSYRIRATDAAGNFSSYSSTVSATTSAGSSLPTPAAAWSLDEGTGTSAADSSGHSNTATLYNSPAWTTGNSGNALSFTGGSAYAKANASASLANLSAGGLTIAAWVKPSSAGTGGRIVDKDNDAAGWFLKFDTGLIAFTGDKFATAAATRVAAGTLTTGVWQHVAVTWTGSSTGTTIHLYINGVLSDGTATDGSGSAADDTAVPFTIGNRSSDAAKGFNGVIDDVRVYSQVLTATQIASLVGDATAPTAPSGLTATAASSSQINLTWTASTDNVGVTGYRVERCSGSSCSTFTQVGTPTTTSYSDTGLTASTSYTYRVRAVDAAGNLSSYSGSGTATTQAASDTQAPTAPTGVTASAASSTQINLSWTASTDNVGVTGYRIERCQGGGCSTFTQIGTPTAASYNDAGLAAATSYTYRVRASDAAGNLSAYSATATATTQAASDTQAPTSPTGLTASAASSAQINLNWTASTDNVGVTGYRVERCSGSGCSTFTQVGTPTGTSYSDTGLSASTSYTYRVRAADAAGNLSAYSSTATAVTQATSDTQAPTTPTGVSAAAASNTQINLSWTASTDNVSVTAYRIERCQGGGCSNFTQVATSSGTSYFDTGLTTSASYSYRLRAADAAGNLSSYSSTVTATAMLGTNTYTYDSHGRLATLTKASGQTITYGYDAVGNLTSIQASP